MDFLECGICHIAYNEEELKPRNSPCGHEFCSTCLKALINDGEYICPKCREKFKVTAVEELPVAFGLIDVIRAFRANTISLTKESDLKITGAINEDICNIHLKVISHWCYHCQLWICVDCIDSHTSLTGCSTTSATKAVGDLKDHNNKSVDQLLTKFKKDTNYLASKIQDHTNKRKEHLEIAEKHGEEVKRIQQLLLQGTDHKEKLEDSKKSLNETNSPLTISESIKVVTQRKQILLSWSAKNIGPNTGPDTLPEIKQEFLKAIEERRDVYVEKTIKEEKRLSKLSQHNGNIYVHTFRSQFFKPNCKFMTFDQLEKMIPSDASLIFLEISLGGVVQGKVHVRLDKNLPNTRKYILQLVMGERGDSIYHKNLFEGVTQLYNSALPFSQITFTPDTNVNSAANKWDVFGKFNESYLAGIFFEFSIERSYYEKSYYVFGRVEEGKDILQKCHDTRIYRNITECGIIIENQLDAHLSI